AVLDLGCGDGILGSAVLDQFPAAEGVLVDFSQPMLDAAQTRLAGKNVSLLALDYGQLGWQEKLPLQQFDVIVSGFSIHHQPDARKKTLYAELFELLSPGGIFLNLEHVASPTPWLEAQHDALFLEAMMAFQKGSPNPKTFDELATGYHARPDKEANILALVETQCDWLREIDYAQVDVYLKIFELALFGGIREPDAEASGNGTPTAV
ncbi:MAG: class I SAM-dependent methyltransferase, partial [Symploca sp. SIO1C4]|nr:class I SAM-dependent methyltransferase [Symploca sp. SIO1C4]